MFPRVDQPSWVSRFRLRIAMHPDAVMTYEYFLIALPRIPARPFSPLFLNQTAILPLAVRQPLPKCQQGAAFGGARARGHRDTKSESPSPNSPNHVLAL